MFKNIVDSFKGLVEVAGASISPYAVSSVKLEDYSGSTKKSQDGYLTLYKKVGCYDCVVVSTSTPPTYWSIFRLANDGEAFAQFGLFSAKLNVLIAKSSSVFNNLQRVTDVIKEHPSWSPIHIAAYLGMYEFILQGDNVRGMNDKTATREITPLMVSVMGKQLQCLEHLLQAGADIKAQDNSGKTVFHYAVKHEPKCIPMIAAYDKDHVIDFIDNNGQTALYAACEDGIIEAVEELVKCGAKPDVSSCDMLPIHVAMKTSNIRSMELICEKHADQLFARDNKYGGTPVHWAQNREVIEKMCQLGCDINIQSDTGHTPLHIMLQSDRRDCIMELLVFGADTRKVDNHGDTPLHVAVLKDDVELVKLFIVFGADVNMLNKKGESPRHLASVSKGKNRDTLLNMLHISGAKRCSTQAKGCFKGCVHEGNFNGTSDDTMKFMMTIDREVIVDEMMASLEMKDPDRDCDSSVHKDSVLCLDGGGIRGLCLIHLLIAIEEAAGIPIKDCFDWIAGTSTGGLLALGIAVDKPLSYMKGLYVRLKDEVFKGSRPYASELFEEMLKKELGEKVMTDIKGPKVIVTSVLADRHPSQLHLFRSYHPTLSMYKDENHPEERLVPNPPDKQLIWEAARSSGAAPTYFKQSRAFVDGGMISNNPTLDTLTEIHEYNCGLKMRNNGHLIKPIGCVVSLGTGRIPVRSVASVDVFRPEGIMDVKKVITGFTGLVTMMVDQATLSEGPPVDRSRAWCSMLNIPFYRFSPRLGEDIPLDCHDNKAIIRMMWETQCYIVANKDKINRLGKLLRSLHDSRLRE